MLKHKTNDLLHLLSILESIEKINLYSKDSKSAESFFEDNDQINFNATELIAKLFHNQHNITTQLRTKPQT